MRKSDYRSTAQNRAQARQANLHARQTEAWQVARRAANLLKQYVPQVWLFGSLASGEGFWERSDIDLAVPRLDVETYLTLVAELQDLSPAFKIDLVDLSRCSESLKTLINEKGLAL